MIAPQTTLYKFKSKISLILILFFAFNNLLFAQNLHSAVVSPFNLDGTSNFFTLQNIMNDYWEQQYVNNGYVLENGVEKKVPNWKLYKRWEYYWEQRVNQETGEFPTTNSVAEYEKYKSTQNILTKVNYDESWINLGTNSSAGGYAGIGRINCIAFHPSDLNTFWVGSPSGGIWKTSDGGSSWAILNNNESVLGVSDIAIPSDFATSNTLYIATGDRDGGSMWSLGGGQSADNPSIGVLKSTDDGTTWNTTGLVFAKGFARITRLLIDPTDNNILLASTLAGIYRTSDAGASWSLVDPFLNRWIDMEFKPGDHNTIYASSSGYSSSYLNISTDNGVTWSFSAIAAGGYRAEIAVTPNDPTLIYMLSCTNTGGLLGIHKSTNSGASFSQINTNTGQNMLGYYSDGSGATSGQGTYDLCIAASPTDANTVYIGGVNNWKSVDGGVTWTISNMWTNSAFYNFGGAPVAHADKHALAFQNGTTLFEGNDGGIYKTTNGGTTWSDLSNGLVISQLYRIGGSQTNPTTVLTGLQDNGTKLFSGGFWTDPKGGDGMECIIDYTDPTYMYATYVRGQISRSTNTGASFPTNISALIPGGQPIGAWVTPYVIDQNNSATLFAGYDQVWKTTDRGNNWTSASQQLSASTKLRSLAIAPSNSNVLYAADQTNMWKTTDGGATNWTTVPLPALSGNSITYIAVNNTDPNTVWITCGGYTDGSKVFQSIDGGANWTNISTGLPNLPVMSIVYYKKATNRSVLFVGTDVGVYVKNGTGNWETFNSGLPNVVVSELEILYTGGTDKLRAGTFGRGLWETNIDAALPVEITSFAYSAKNNSVMLNWSTATEVNNYGFEVERMSNVKSQTLNDWEKIGFVNGNGNSNSTKNYVYEDKNINSGKFSYRLKQIDNDGQYSYSNIIEVDLGIPKEFALSQNYPNPFNPSTVISYQLSENSQVTLKVYGILGNEVTTVVNQTQDAGKYDVKFDASNYSNGVYFYQIKADNFTATKKMILVK